MVFLVEKGGGGKFYHRIKEGEKIHSQKTIRTEKKNETCVKASPNEELSLFQT